jgi:hypothetical protein
MDISFRQLYEQILDYEGESFYGDVLANGFIDQKSIQIMIGEVSKFNPFTIIEQLSNENFQDLSWELYALSRVLDILTLGLQPNNNGDGSYWSGPELDLADYIKFIKSLGLEVMPSANYSAFQYEIMEATEGKGEIEVAKTFFPTIMLKNLIIKRGGVAVLCDPQKYNLSSMNNSTIYWTFRRKNRKYADLSQGWGSNSQWRTNFRFDYELDDSFIYNAAGNLDLNRPNQEAFENLAHDRLTVEEAIELTINRHFLTNLKQETDLFPYNYKYTEKKHSIGEANAKWFDFQG